MLFANKIKRSNQNTTMENKYTCLKCAEEQASGGVKKSFLGFPKFKCLKCGFDNLYPASTGMVVIYVILALALIPMFKVASNGGGLFSPVLIFVAICGVIGITTNIRARKAYQERNKGDS